MAGRRKLYLPVEDPIGNQQAAEKDAGRAQICVCLPSLSTVFVHFKTFFLRSKGTKEERKASTSDGKSPLAFKSCQYFLKSIKSLKDWEFSANFPYIYSLRQYLQTYAQLMCIIYKYTTLFILSISWNILELSWLVLKICLFVRPTQTSI